MPESVAQSTNNKISGKGYRTRHRWRGSDNAEKWSSKDADRSEGDMEGSESSKSPMNHISSARAPPVNLKRLPWVKPPQTEIAR